MRASKYISTVLFSFNYYYLHGTLMILLHAKANTSLNMLTCVARLDPKKTYSVIAHGLAQLQRWIARNLPLEAAEILRRRWLKKRPRPRTSGKPSVVVAS
jgi:hypothetical protein